MNSFTFRNVNEALPALCKEVLTNGDEVGSRNGRTMELPFTHITLTHPWERYITVPGRKASLPAQIAETMWILAGRNDIEWLSHYLPRAAEFSDDGKTWRGGYGPRLRKWDILEQDRNININSRSIDQLKHVVELLKKEPLTRRAVMSIYNPATDVDPGKDIPCNQTLQFMSRLGKLDMHVFIRSNDLMWGWSGINAFEWSALQEIVAQLLGIGVGQLHFSISSLHLYDRHWKKAEELSRAEVLNTQALPPQFKPAYRSVEALDQHVGLWFNIERIIREDGSEAARKAIESFPEPMMRHWLAVIAKYHDPVFDVLLPDTVAEALSRSPKKPVHNWNCASVTGKADGSVDCDCGPEQTTMTPFVAYVDNLHREKTKAYGDSWKRRGEMLGIMANIARKIDRLGQNGGGDTATDTAVDVLAYLIKHRLWLDEQAGGDLNSDNLDHFTEALVRLSNQPQLGSVLLGSVTEAEKELTELFEVLEHQVEEKRATRYEVVESMSRIAYRLASHLWWKDQNATRAFTGYLS